MKVDEPAASALGTTTPAAQTLRGLERAGVPAGVLDPIEILAPAGTEPAAIAQRLATLPGVRTATATAPAGPAWRRGDTSLVGVQPAVEPSSAAGQATLARVGQVAASKPGVLAGGRSADRVIGQVARYVSWVRKHLAASGQSVEGIVVAHEHDDRCVTPLPPCQAS